VNNFGAIKGVTAVLTRFSSEILPPQVAGDFKGNEYHTDLERIRTEQIPLQRNDDKTASNSVSNNNDLVKRISLCVFTCKL
ncbi:MAG: hypothetical protein WCR45_12480, partial [Bacteroidaceae bacterium]